MATKKTIQFSTVDTRCVSCGKPIELDARNRRLRCCGRSSAEKNGTRKYKLPTFVGVDGEGVTDADGTHRYVLLSVGEKSFHRDGAHLTFSDCMQFLWDCFCDDPQPVYVGYYLGYDFTQWIRTLPADRAQMLLNPVKRERTESGGNPIPFPVEYDGWEFDMLAMRRFKLRKADAKEWLYVCDVGSFFQQPFATAILDWRDENGREIEIMTKDELRIIERGKARRNSAVLDQEMIEYNLAENRVLARMMHHTAEGFLAMGVKLKRSQWIGPGQAAQVWLGNTAPEHSAENLVENAGKGCRKAFLHGLDAARQSFFGGWFETFAHGHVPGPTYEYDISSAYPHIQSQLPCLLHGKWSMGKGKLPLRGKLGRYTLVRATIRGDNPVIGAMPHRDSRGKIWRPHWVQGWYWLHEVDAAREANCVKSMTVHEWVTYHPCKCPPPFRGLRDLYAQRQAVGKSTPRGRALKLVYNSAYGKMAQSVGVPKFANPIYASLITSGCRTMILDAIATHPSGEGSSYTVMVATDGVYFTAPHTGLQNETPGLGAWEETVKQNLTIMLPGLYWDDAARKSRKARVLKIKSRGVNARDLIQRLDDLDAQYTRMLKQSLQKFRFEFGANGMEASWWPKLEIPVSFQMVSPRQALMRNSWDLCGTVVRGATRTVYGAPRHKRGDAMAPLRGVKNHIWSVPPENILHEPSHAYDKKFGLALEDHMLSDTALTQEGDAMEEAWKIIGVKG